MFVRQDDDDEEEEGEGDEVVGEESGGEGRMATAAATKRVLINQGHVG